MAWRRADDDKVTFDVRVEVLRRDNYRCVAPELDWPEQGKCRNRYGDTIFSAEQLKLDHVHEQPGGVKGDRAKSDIWHLVTLCWWHHQGSSGWATSHRPLLRKHIVDANERRRPRVDS